MTYGRKRASQNLSSPLVARLFCGDFFLFCWQESSRPITAAVHVSWGERALPSLLISQVLTGEQPFSMEELFPIRAVTPDTTGYSWTAECQNGDRLSISFDKLTFTL